MLTDSVKPASALWLRFAELYAGDGAAAMAAAGSTASAASRASMASRALRHPDVQAVIERRRREAREGGGVGPERIEAPAPAAVRREPQPPAEPADLDDDDAVEQRRVSVRRAVAEAEVAGVDPIAVLEQIALGPDVHASSRVAAAKALERHQRETNNAAADPYADLRARVAEILRKKRERERD